MSPKIIKLAQDVLNIEANEILKASDKISNEFSDAVEMYSSAVKEELF